MHLDSSEAADPFHILAGVDAGTDDSSPQSDSTPKPQIPKPQSPDLTPLPRAAAATVEMLAEAAGIHFASRIRMAQALLEKAPSPGRYRDTLAGELAMHRVHLAEARAFEAAARRRRVETTSEEEELLLEIAREQNPGLCGANLDALLRSAPATDALDNVGARLDSAAGAFRDFCSSADLGDEAEAPFACLQAALEDARSTYRRLLAARAGQSAATIERRLAS